MYRRTVPVTRPSADGEAHRERADVAHPVVGLERGRVLAGARRPAVVELADVGDVVARRRGDIRAVEVEVDLLDRVVVARGGGEVVGTSADRRAVTGVRPE